MLAASCPFGIDSIELTILTIFKFLVLHPPLNFFNVCRSVSNRGSKFIWFYYAVSFYYTWNAASRPKHLKVTSQTAVGIHFKLFYEKSVQFPFQPFLLFFELFLFIDILQKLGFVNCHNITLLSKWLFIL